MAMNLADEILVVDPQEAMKTAMDLARSGASTADGFSVYVVRLGRYPLWLFNIAMEAMAHL